LTIQDAIKSFCQAHSRQSKIHLEKIIKFLVTASILTFFTLSAVVASDLPSDVSMAVPGESRTVAFTTFPIKYLDQNVEGKSNWCLVYSTAMLLSHYEIEENPDVIARDLGLTSRKNSYYNMKSFFSGEGSVEKMIQDRYNLKTQKKIFVTLRDTTESWLRENLGNNRPVIMIYGQLYGHAVVLVGYDEEYVYMNDPSGAFFSEASELFDRNLEPAVWLSSERVSPYQGAGVKWGDFRTFIRERNLWGYMITITGIKDKSLGRTICKRTPGVPLK
jgi:hypothetical protein